MTFFTFQHPSLILSILADNWQEHIEVALVPLLTSAVVPMSFHEAWVTFGYLAYSETLGHTGIRACWGLPVTSPVLRWVGMDLWIEDHDLHHRFGKSGRNYGKASRVWDVVFKTTTDRIETRGLGARET